MARKAAKKKASDAAAAPPAVSFEKQLAELEAIVEELEGGDQSLDESLTLYEQGVAALKNCHAVLNAAEKRIQILVEESGGALALKEAAGADDDDDEDDDEDSDDDSDDDAEDEDDLDEDDEESGEEETKLF